jgi:hypothetical protein
MTRRWRKLGWFGPSKRQLRRAEAEIEAVKAVRDNRLRDANPADIAKAESVADELFGTDMKIESAKRFYAALERHGLADEYQGVTDLILDAGHGAPLLSEPLHAGSLSNLHEDIRALYRAYVAELERRDATDDEAT